MAPAPGITVEELLGKLQAVGLRRTKTRRALLRLLLDAAEPLAVQQILTQLPPSETELNKTTIYRELETLCGQGIVRELQFGDERSKRYELALDEHHHHIRCVECGRIQDVHIDREIRTAARAVAHQTGFSIVEHEVEFLGLCQKCA